MEPPVPKTVGELEGELTEAGGAKDWNRIYDAVKSTKDPQEAYDLVGEFLECPDAAVRRHFLLLLMRGDRESVALHAGTVLAQSGVVSRDAADYWEVHDRSDNYHFKDWIVQCIGLTGDAGSVRRLVAIARSQMPESAALDEKTIKMQFDRPGWVHSAARSMYMITAQWEEPGQGGPREPEAYDAALKEAALLESDATGTERVALLERFERDLLTERRAVAQFALLRLTGQHPIPDWYFLPMGGEGNDDSWVAYAAAWESWRKQNEGKVTWNAQRECLEASEPPPPVITSFMSQRDLDSLRRSIGELLSPP